MKFKFKTKIKPAGATDEYINLERLEDIPKIIKLKTKEMEESAKNLAFEKAALIRDEIMQLQRLQLR